MKSFIALMVGGFLLAGCATKEPVSATKEPISADELMAATVRASDAQLKWMEFSAMRKVPEDRQREYLSASVERDISLLNLIEMSRLQKAQLPAGK